MIFIILHHLLIITITMIILLFLRSLFICLHFKYKYKEKVIVFYFPIFGYAFYELYSIILKKDCLYYFKYHLNKNPQAKVAIANILFINIYNIVDPEYAKEFSLKHDFFRKYRFFPDQMLLSSGIFFSEGEKWKNLRNVLS